MKALWIKIYRGSLLWINCLTITIKYRKKRWLKLNRKETLKHKKKLFKITWDNQPLMFYWKILGIVMRGRMMPLRHLKILKWRANLKKLTKNFCILWTKNWLMNFKIEWGKWSIKSIWIIICPLIVNIF